MKRVPEVVQGMKPVREIQVFEDQVGISSGVLDFRLLFEGVEKFSGRSEFLKASLGLIQLFSHPMLVSRYGEGFSGSSKSKIRQRDPSF